MTVPPRLLAFVLVAFLPAACAPATTPATEPSDRASSEEAPELEAAELERALHRRVNRVRREHGLDTLRWDESMRPLARAHSRDMAQRGFFGHVNYDGEDANDRAQRLGLPVCKRSLGDGRTMMGYAENLSRLSRYASYRDVYRSGPQGREKVRREYDWRSRREIVRRVVQNWLDSPPHRKNLLNPHADRHALGVFETDEHHLYITQNLC